MSPNHPKNSFPPQGGAPNTRRKPPSWVHEGLVAATEAAAEVSTEVSKAATTEAKTASWSVGANVSEVRETVQDLIRERPNVASWMSCRTFLSRLGFTDREKLSATFSEKTILDVGGGFGGIAPNLWSFARKITVVDPIFLEADHAADHARNIEHLKNHLAVLQNRMEEVKTTSEELAETVHARIVETTRSHAETIWWNGYDGTKPTNVARLGAYAENMPAIADASQDFVFLSHVLGKETVDPKGIVAELDRVLLPHGRIFITNRIDAETGKRFFEAIRAISGVFVGELRFFQDDEGVYEFRRKGGCSALTSHS